MLIQHIGHILGRFAADRNLFVVLNEIYARADRDPELRTVLLANDHAWADYLRTIFAAGRDAGQFRADLDPDGATVLAGAGPPKAPRSHECPLWIVVRRVGGGIDVPAAGSRPRERHGTARNAHEGVITSGSRSGVIRRHPCHPYS
jgi:hypothetical protein